MSYPAVDEHDGTIRGLLRRRELPGERTGKHKGKCSGPSTNADKGQSGEQWSQDDFQHFLYKCRNCHENVHKASQ